LAEPVASYTAWTFPPWAAAGLLISAVVYVRGWQRIRVTRPGLFPPWRLWCFLGGLSSIWIALASPIDSLDDVLLTAHMAQHLILMSVAPPLLLLGAPAVPLLRGLPRWFLRPVLGPLFRAPWLHRAFRVVTYPVFAFMAMNLAYAGWHVPFAYELALRSEAWHSVEHACFFWTSLLFWFPVIQPWPSVSRWSRWNLVPYLVGADLVNTGVSASLTFAGRVIYPSYAAAPRVFDISALNDQAAAGAFMWVLGSIIFLVPAVIAVSHLLSPKAGSGLRRVIPVNKAG
jgi:putative membrane protein